MNLLERIVRFFGWNDEPFDPSIHTHRSADHFMLRICIRYRGVIGLSFHTYCRLSTALQLHKEGYQLFYAEGSDSKTWIHDLQIRSILRTYDEYVLLGPHFWV